MRDREYVKAFLEKLSEFHADVYAEVISINELGNTDGSTIVVTDYPAGSFEQSDLDIFSARLIFFVNRIDDSRNNNCLFKYQSFSLIMAYIAQCYYSLTGDRVRNCGYSELICVCGDDDCYNYGYISKSIAGKLKYGKGGEYLLISLRPINAYGYVDESERGKLSRIVYTLEAGRGFSVEEFCRVDEYGVHYLSLGVGLNRLSLIDWKTLERFIDGLRRYFTGVVVDVGTHFTIEAVKLINEADSIWWISDKYTDRIISQTVAEPQNKDIHILDYSREDIDLEIDEIINQGGISG